MITFERTLRCCLAGFVLSIAMAAPACSPGSLPGSPSPILRGSGGGRYDGTLSFRRVGGAFAVDETAQAMQLSLVLTTEDQFSAEFQTSRGSSGTLQGTVQGALNNGTFAATLLVSLPADSGAAVLGALGGGIFGPRALVACEGRGEAIGSFSGPTVTWTTGTITYTNCTGLVTSSQAQATAVSPIPSPLQARANIAVTILPGTTVAEGVCANGQRGFPFTIEIAETGGVSVTLDDSITIEERRGGQPVSTRTVDNPITTLRAGEKRRYDVCSPFTGTYQAFFSGRDANGNALRFGSPIVTLGR